MITEFAASLQAIIILLQYASNLGGLRENYIIAVRVKRQEYMCITTDPYFWRVCDKKEIDFAEERNGKLYGYEIKWKNAREKNLKDWKNSYYDACFKVIHKEYYMEFIQ